MWGMVWQARFGLVRHGTVGLGLARQARLVRVWRVGVGHDKAGLESQKGDDED